MQERRKPSSDENGFEEKTEMKSAEADRNVLLISIKEMTRTKNRS
jgi:hypothetical protein